MYQAFYRLADSPFALTADPKYFYASQSHREALALVQHQLRRRSGLVVLLGEVGTGKTTLVRHIIGTLGPTTGAAVVLSPPATVDELLQIVSQELQIPCQSGRRAEMIEALSQYLGQEAAAGRDVVIVVDEAQHLSPVLLEEIRLLLSLETAGHLQVILVGQPAFRAKLAWPELRPFRQRIGSVAELTPFCYQETVDYIAHRLKVAGYTGRSLFSRSALLSIHRASDGIPRLVNAICDSCLLRGYAAGAPRIDAQIVKAVLEDRSDVQRDVVTSLIGVRRARPTDRGMRTASRWGWITAVLLLPLVAGTFLLVAPPGGGVALRPPAGPPRDIGEAERQAPAETLQEEAVGPEETVSLPPRAPLELPDNAATSREASQVRRVTVKPGDTIASLVMNVYGRVDYTLLDVVKMANPEVGNLNSIHSGQRLRFPRLEPRAMVQERANGLYRVHLATVWDTSSGEFAHLREAVLKSGRRLYLTPVRLTDDSREPSPFPHYPEVYRVMVGDFADREQAEAFYRMFQGRLDAPRAASPAGHPSPSGLER
jgi:general secretion pathway protein A